MKNLSLAPTLTALTLIYVSLTLLIMKEAIDILDGTNILKRFNIKVKEVTNNRQRIDGEIKKEIKNLENKTFRSSELPSAIGDIFKKVTSGFSKNGDKVSFVFSINSKKTNNESYEVLVKYEVTIEAKDYFFYIKSEIVGEKDIVINLSEDSEQK